MIEEALVEALAQEHFNYIAEGGGRGSPPAAMGRQGSWPSASRRRREGGGGRLLRLLSPRTAMSLVTLVATVVAARHLRDFLVDFMKEAFSPSGEGGGDGGGGVAEAVRVKR